MTFKANKVAAFGCVMVALSIMLGAFAAHYLKNKLKADAAQIETFKTAVLYLLFNSLGLITLAILAKQFTLNLSKAIISLILGMLFFSGSLIALTIAAINNVSVAFLGPITPFGGVFLIIAWLITGFKLLKNT
jgi:uncharacterized membrane protein YgdD (TMEM256/DUF423 family)